MFVDIFVESDDDTYVYGDRYFKALTVDGVECEPYYLKNDDKIIAFYPSKHLFIEYIDAKIVSIIYTMTCSSDDFAKYSFNDGVLVELYETCHGVRNVTVSYCNGVISDVVFGGKKFGRFAVGKSAPDFTDMFDVYAISNNAIDELMN